MPSAAARDFAPAISGFSLTRRRDLSPEKRPSIRNGPDTEGLRPGVSFCTRKRGRDAGVQRPERAGEHELKQLPWIAAAKACRMVHYRTVRKGSQGRAGCADRPGIIKEDVEAMRPRAWIRREGVAHRDVRTRRRLRVGKGGGT
jgi:hypothetical protein